MNKYKEAVMKNITFETNRGNVSIQDLFNMPMTGSFSLNAIGVALKKKIADASESLVNKSTDKLSELKLKLVQDVIDTRLAAIETSKLSADKRKRRHDLTQALEVKRMKALSEMSEEDILKELDNS